MKIALIGYGQMGKEVEKSALLLGHSITAHATSKNFDLDAIKNADICIDFTRPECAINNVKRLSSLKKNIVIGTTGWYNHLEELKPMIEEHHIGLLYGPNFSLGIHLFLNIVAKACAIMNHSDYAIACLELHHSKKIDRPSGTAKAIEKAVKSQMPALSELSIESVRCGEIPGTHTLLFESECDSIQLTHTARNRSGFALGAVKAAEWLYGKKGLFTFEDYLKSSNLA